MKDIYKAKLKDGREIFIPNWPIDVALENLTLAGKCFGTDKIINISAINIPAVIVGIMECEDAAMAARMIKHFVCQVRIDGKKITPETINNMFEGDLKSIAEMFAHVIHSQYADFFESGLAKAPSQDK